MNTALNDKSARGQEPRAIWISDIDWTLRDAGMPLPRTVVEFIAWFEARGGLFIPASGRSVEHLRELFAEAGIVCTAICGENGAHVWHSLDGVPEDLYFADRQAQALAKRYLSETSECNSWIGEEKKVVVFTALFDSPQTAERKAAIWRVHLRQLLGRDVGVYHHADGHVDVVADPKMTSKANIVRFAIERFGGTSVVVAGDGENDLPMFSNPRVIPVCPANAIERIRMRTIHDDRGHYHHKQNAEGTLGAMKEVLRKMRF